ncbi:MAG: protein kinase [Planctomycetes bacterium]|nr:protein kinase [Planctomycetota bacterium]
MLEPASALATARFLERYAEDRDSGSVRTLEEYQALFPGFEGAIASAFAELQTPSAAPERDPRMPDRLGPYVLIEEIGRGGQATVYLAEHPELGQKVALKVLRGLVHSEHIERFLREARIASRLEHPHVCRLYYSGTEHGLPYLAMEFVKGESLARKIARSKGTGSAFELALPDPPGGTTKNWIDRALLLIEKVARAVQQAHDARVVHRDLNPNNILVRDNGEPAVVDFGLARSCDKDEPIVTRSGDVFGTVHYMSPEQLTGASHDDPRIDVWSLGVTLHEMLTGVRPFQAASDAATIDRILRHGFEDPSRQRKGLGRDVVQCIRTAICGELSLRYQSAEAFADDLRRIRERRPILARPVPAWIRAVRWIQRSPALAAAISVALLATTIGMIVSIVLFVYADQKRREADNSRDESRKRLAEAKFDSGETQRKRGFWDDALQRYDFAENFDFDRIAIGLSRSRLHLSRFDFQAARKEVAALRASTLTFEQSSQLDFIEALIRTFDTGEARDPQHEAYVKLANAELRSSDSTFAHAMIADSLAQTEHSLRRALIQDRNHFPSLLMVPTTMLFSGQTEEFLSASRDFRRRFVDHPYSAFLLSLEASVTRSDKTPPGRDLPRFGLRLHQWIPEELAQPGHRVCDFVSRLLTHEDRAIAVPPIILECYRRFAEQDARLDGAKWNEATRIEHERLYESVPDALIRLTEWFQNGRNTVPDPDDKTVQARWTQLATLKRSWTVVRLMTEHAGDWERWISGLQIRCLVQAIETLDKNAQALRRAELRRDLRQLAYAALSRSDLDAKEFEFLWLQLLRTSCRTAALAVVSRWQESSPEDRNVLLHLAFSHYWIGSPSECLRSLDRLKREPRLAAGLLEKIDRLEQAARGQLGNTSRPEDKLWLK